MSMHFFVDTNHAGKTETRKSQIGILMFCNSATIIRFINRQNSAEASTFGSEFTVMKNSVEIIETLRYKLCMFRFPIDGLTSIFCDNGTVCVNTTRPEWTLSNKHHSIDYQRARELFVAGPVIVSKEHILTDLSNLFTKTMAVPKREGILENFTY